LKIENCQNFNVVDSVFKHILVTFKGQPPVVLHISVIIVA